MRNNLPLHDMTGGNAWMGPVIASLYPGETDAGALADASARAVGTLQKAATLDLALAPEGDSLRATVRVTNRTGHKSAHRLSGGATHVGQRGGAQQRRHAALRLGAVRYGHRRFDARTAGPRVRGAPRHLEGRGARLRPAAWRQLPLRPRLLFKDNRIPPLGFSNAAFDAFGGRPVDPEGPEPRYPDDQNWDESTCALPVGTATVTATLYYQTTSKEYVEFLRDTNTTNGAGQALYDAWTAHARSAPVVMATRTTSTSASGAPDRPSLPTALGLRALRNPFRGALELELALPHTTDVVFDVFDVSGAAAWPTVRWAGCSRDGIAWRGTARPPSARRRAPASTGRLCARTSDA